MCSFLKDEQFAWQKREEQYNITKQNDLFKVTEAQQRRMCLKNLSLNIDGTRGKSERSSKRGGLDGGKIRLLRAFHGGWGLRSLHSMRQVERSHKTDTGLNHLDVKLLFLLRIHMSSPVIT